MRNLAQQFSSFVSVGLLATAAHYAVLIALVEAIGVSPVPASAAGAFVGACLSYALNRTRTFESKRPHVQAVVRFMIVAGIAMILNATLMILFTQHLALPYVAAQVVSTGLIVIITFSANKFWTFNDAR